MRSASPLRYPGGKWRLNAFLSEYVKRNFSAPPQYIEPYAGGASLALSLLLGGTVRKIWLNDLDRAIHACWHSILYESERFCDAVENVPLTVDERQKQKRVYSNGLKADSFSLGFAAFFLNRTNHSGILNGGMIGGKSQNGAWRIDARFNRSELARRIRRIAEHREQIRLTRLDAVALLKRLGGTSDSLVYLDPPYVTAGKALYMNCYDENDHLLVSNVTMALRRKWIVSYDDVPLVRKLYKGFRSRRFEMLHTARVAKLGSEVLFFSPDSTIPTSRAFRRLSRG